MLIRSFCLSLLILAATVSVASAQIDVNEQMKHEAAIVGSMDMPVESNGVVEFIPFLQKQVREMGGTPPKPFFIAPLMFVFGDEMVISNVQASLNSAVPGLTPEEINNSFKLNNTKIRGNAFGVRGGFWLFPFLSIYGMYVNTNGSTTFGIEVPPELLRYTAGIKTETKLYVNTYAVGATAAYGLKNLFWGFDVFANMDLNFSWSDVNILDTMIQSVVFSPRVGVARELNKTFNVAIWVGGMYRDSINQSSRVAGVYDLGGGLKASYSAQQRPISTWNLAVGGKVGISRYFDLVVEGGFLYRWSVNVNTVFNF